MTIYLKLYKLKSYKYIVVFYSVIYLFVKINYICNSIANLIKCKH